MPTLQLAIDVEISPAEQDLLCDVLSCQLAGLAAEIARFGPAAVREYLDMFTGSAGITTATDVRERRLVGMMLTVFHDAPPDADKVARLFNITASAARALLRAVAAKHRLKIRAQIETAIRQVLDAANQQAGNQPYKVVVHNPLVVELLNLQLGASPDPRAPVRLSADSVNNYVIDIGSFGFLRGLYP